MIYTCNNCLSVVRQLEQRVKAILDSIATGEDRKRELIRGDAVDKAEQLSKSKRQEYYPCQEVCNQRGNGLSINLCKLKGPWQSKR